MRLSANVKIIQYEIRLKPSGDTNTTAKCMKECRGVSGLRIPYGLRSPLSPTVDALKAFIKRKP